MFQGGYKLFGDGFCAQAAQDFYISLKKHLGADGMLAKARSEMLGRITQQDSRLCRGCCFARGVHITSNIVGQNLQKIFSNKRDKDNQRSLILASQFPEKDPIHL